MRTQLIPTKILDDEENFTAQMIFGVPNGKDVIVNFPREHANAVRAEFEGRSRGPSLFDLWCAGNLVDGQYTEVIVEFADDRVRFSLVFVSGGPIWRTSVDPIDALLTGFHFRLPFFMTQPSTADLLPVLINAPREISVARFACSNTTSLSSIEP